MGYLTHVAVRFDTIGRLVGATRTDAGFLRIKARLTRTGVLSYITAAGVQRELRHPDDVFRADSLATAGSGLPITVGHLGMITTQNVGAKVGQTRSDVEIEADTFLVAELQIEDPSVIDRIDRGELVEISAGYRADTIAESGVWNGESYDARHTNIRYNHLALLPSGGGRAGSQVALKFDAADDVGYAPTMDLVEITIGDKTFSVPAEVAAEIARLSGMAQGQAEGEQAAQELMQASEPVKEDAKPLEVTIVDETPKQDAAETVRECLALIERVREVKPGFKYDGQDKLALMRELLNASGVKCDGKDESWLVTALEVLPMVAVKAAPSALKLDSTETVTKPTPEQVMAERDARRADMWKKTVTNAYQ